MRRTIVQFLTNENRYIKAKLHQCSFVLIYNLNARISVCWSSTKVKQAWWFSQLVLPPNLNSIQSVVLLQMHEIWPPNGSLETAGIQCSNQRPIRPRELHDDVIKWKHFPRYWPFVRGIHRSRWILRTKASDAELWYFLWSSSEWTVE